MRHFIILSAIFFISISTAYSQSGYKNGSIEDIDRISVGAGLGAQVSIGKYPRLKESAVIGNFIVQFEFSERFFVILNTSIEDRNTGTGVTSYINSGIRHSLINYKNTLYPYFETELGLYFVDYLDTYTFENVGNTNSETDNQLFGYNLGMGLDFRISPLATLDINVKFHSFNMNDKKNFFTFLSILKFNI